MNLKRALLMFGFALMVALSLPLRAQTGCDDSPEDPTVVLALVGGAGAMAAGMWGTRGRKQKGSADTRCGSSDRQSPVVRGDIDASRTDVNGGDCVK